MGASDVNQEYLDDLWIRARENPAGASIDGNEVECTGHDQYQIITLTKSGASTREVYIRRREKGEFRRWQQVGRMTKKTTP